MLDHSTISTAPVLKREMTQIKVMQVILDLGPGGAERVVLNYMKFLDKTRFVPLLCVLRRLYPKEQSELVELGIRCYHLNKPPGWSSRTLSRLARIIANEDVDILHLHNFSAMAYGTLASFISKHPVIFRTEHNVISRGDTLIDNLKPETRKLMNLFHRKIITVSDAVKNSHISQTRVFSTKYMTIYNGIDPSDHDLSIDFDKYREEFGLRPENTVIGKVASLYPQKDHEIFLKAAQLVINSIPNARFLIIGDGPRRNELQQLSLSMGLGKATIFTGLRSDVPGLLKFVDIFVLSSAWEGFPMTILEAMASGTAVVVTDVGGNKEAVVHCETGYLVRRRDPKALAEGIIDLASDVSKRLAMGEAGRMRVLDNFTSQIMVRRTEDEYLKAFRS